MNYNAYRYLWPPRPENKIPPGAIGFYEKRGWSAQVKKNGTCCLIFAHGTDVIWKTRHNADHKAWKPPLQIGMLFHRPGWNVYVAELLHSKTTHIKNHLYLFDILVSDSAELTGTTFDERQKILRDRFPGRGESGLGAIRITASVSRAQSFTSGFETIWSKLAKEDEGLVFKNPKATLVACLSPSANNGWQVKCRKSTKNYSF